MSKGKRKVVLGLSVQVNDDFFSEPSPNELTDFVSCVSRRISMDDAVCAFPSGHMVKDLAEMKSPDNIDECKSILRAASPMYSKWAENLKTNSPRRLPPKIDGKDDLPPRFRRIKPVKGCPAYNFSFSCGGWLQFYLFGVAKCLTDHGLHAISEKQKFIGSSAGALVAAGMGLDGCWDVAVSYCQSNLIPQAWRFPWGPFQVTRYLRDAMVRCLDVDLVPQLRDEVMMVVTKFPSFKSERIKTFKSGKHMCDTLLASAACIPLASAIKLDGEWCIDGGFTEFHPILDESYGETVYISPFYFSKADIHPSRYVPIWWAILPPPQPSTIDWLYDMGYLDTLNWMKSKGIAACCQHCPPFTDIAACPFRPSRKIHSFDAHKYSISRLVGYWLENCVLDAILCVFVKVLWKPLIVLLILTEFVALICMKTLQALFIDLYDISPIAALATFLFLPHVVRVGVSIAVMSFIHLYYFGSLAEVEWSQARAYGKNLYRLLKSLCKVSIRREKMRKESMTATEHAANNSVIYRLFLHIF